MPAANKPINEEGRLAALRQYDILDSVEEAEYNDIVKLASAICDMPVSTVTLIDEDRQWYKAKVGIDIEGTPRNIAFCAHTILDPGNPLVIEDMTKDDRMSDNPFVTGELHAAQFYAGFPLKDDNGFVLGTLCVLDMQPRTLTQIQTEALSVLANNVMNLINLRKKTSDLTALYEEMKNEIDRAALLQRQMLPSLKHIDNVKKAYNIDIAGLFKPCTELAGDLWGVRAISDTSYAIYMIDFTGHGVSAAINTFSIHNMMNEDGMFGLEPHHFLAKLNDKLKNSLQIGQFATMFYGVVDTQFEEMVYAAASTTQTILVTKDRTVLLEQKGLPLGVMAGSKYNKHKVPFEKDALMFF
ncbi:MAG: GAF domain-containing SpoIIE family protein phosphatase [Glaciecola sp.]